MKNRFWVAALILLFSFSVYARVIEIRSGTGFYVSPQGHIITNEHVVKSCRIIRIKDGPGFIKATLVATDKDNDLALLETATAPQYIATLRYEQNLKIGDEVTVIGFPVENGKPEDYRMRTARILDTKGPTGQKNWLQFTDALKKGNSGGPLLDQYGNVIGVVRGKASFVEIKYKEFPDGSQEELSRGPEKSSDIAINLPVLTHFLENNMVSFSNMLNFEPLAPEQLLEQGKRYIINVQCLP